MAWDKIIKGIGDVMGIANPLIGVGANILGGLLGKSGQDDTNAMNYKINSENNAFNADEAQKARDFNYMMFEKSNEWNSEGARLDRLRAAGINPLTQSFQGSIATPLQGASASASSPLGMQNPMVAMSQALENTPHALAETELLKAQADSLKAKANADNANAELNAEQKENLSILNSLKKATFTSDRDASIHENLVRFNDAAAKLRAYNECPESLVNAYKDTWQNLSQQYINGHLEFLIREKYHKDIQPKELEQLEGAISNLNAVTESIPIELSLKKRGQDIEKRGQDISMKQTQIQAAVQKYCKGLDVVIAKISQATGIRVAQINSGLNKDVSDLLQPLLNLSRKGIEQFVHIAETKGFSVAFDELFGSVKPHVPIRDFFGTPDYRSEPKF